MDVMLLKLLESDPTLTPDKLTPDMIAEMMALDPDLNQADEKV